MDTLPNEDSSFEDNLLSHWQPVKAAQQWHGMVTAMSPRNQTSCRILNSL